MARQSDETGVTLPPPAQQFALAGGVPRQANASKFAWLVTACLATASAILFYQQLASSAGTKIPQENAGIETATAASSLPAGLISVAVLPFANMSGDATQEFFSDGMTEEIVSTLAKVPDLRVVARESTLQYKGKVNDLRLVGQALGATYLIEGAVRKVGDRVRITARLVNVRDGTNVWANSYDRELTDVFAIQEDIAQAIAGALKMPLSLKSGDRLSSRGEIDPAAYENFLRARALIDGRGLKSITDATALLEHVVDRYPDFAPAWVQLALAYDLTPNARPERNGPAGEFRRVVDVFLPKAEAAAQQAIRADPNSAMAYARLAILEFQRGKPLQSDEYYSKALALDPTGSSFLHAHSEQLATLGRSKESLALRRQLQAIEPFVPVYNDVTASILWVNGRNDEAIAVAKTLPSDGRGGLAIIYASMGRYSEAVDALLNNRSGVNSAGVVADAVRLLRSIPAKADSPEKLPDLGTRLSWVYLYVGAPERVMDSYERIVEGGRIPGQEMVWLWHASYAPVRKTERFKTFVRKAGFVDYWRAKGWPDLCHPTTGDDFVCD